MSEHDELRSWLLLLRAPGLGPGGLREQLAAHGGCIGTVLDRLRHSRLAADEPIRRWLERPDEPRVAADLAWLAESGHALLRCTDADFPPQLETIAQAPAALFVAGDPGLLLLPQVAIVGARGATQAGLAHARAFAGALAGAGLVVTSGMADGIDGAAHVAAMDAGAPTIAVVGTGADRVYPAKHQALARRIASNGAVVSEFPPGTAARADHFPRRNRIIAGLSLGTLVIEAGLKSGSLITARLAGEQGREVFALPGSLHNPLARGCHRLIRDGARLTEDVAEVIEALAPAARALGSALAARLAADPCGNSAGQTGTRTSGGIDLPMAQGERAVRYSAPPHPSAVAGWRGDPDYRCLLDALGHDPAALDELVARTGQPPAALSSMLLMLELEGCVEGLPGNRYQRLPA